MRWIAALALAGASLLGGCFESKLNFCANGAICPETLACTERMPIACGPADDVAACSGMADRALCSSDAAPNGTCSSGVCVPCLPEYVECRFSAWTPMRSPTTERLNAVWTVADDDAYAAGAAGAVLHYDGRQWTALPSPTTTSSLIGVWAAAGGDVVTIAQDGVVFRLVAGAWQTITPSPQVVLFGIWGTAIDDLYVVGEMGSILRFDGTTWTPMTSNTVRTLNAVWGASATSIVAAGAAGTIQQYNGANWQAAPNTPLTGLTLRGVWTSGTRTAAVGINQSAMAIIATKEAAGWNTQTAATMYLTGVWGVADDNIYAVGAGGTIMQFDGARWLPMDSGTQVPLQAVNGTTTNVFAVGNVGTILRLSVN